MLNRIICSVVLMLFSVVSFIGCGFIGTKESVPVEKVGLLYVSENRPATVLIGVLGWHHNTCVDGDAKISADRDGKTIHLTATMRVYSGFGGCGDAVSDVYGEVTVRNLEVGEYKVMYGDRELLKFRIAEDAGYVKSGPIVEYLEFTMKTATVLKYFHVTMKLLNLFRLRWVWSDTLIANVCPTSRHTLNVITCGVISSISTLIYQVKCQSSIQSVR